MHVTILSLLLTGFAVTATAEDKTCTVDGMHCSGCQEMVTDKVCDGAKYSTCSVKILDEGKKIGEIHLVTKDAKAKVDEKALRNTVESAGYKISSCKAKRRKKGA